MIYIDIYQDKLISKYSILDIICRSCWIFNLNMMKKVVSKSTNESQIECSKNFELLLDNVAKNSNETKEEQTEGNYSSIVFI